MKRITLITLLLGALYPQIEPTAGAVSTDEKIKHKVNFYGTLETHQGQKYKINNISIDNRYEQIRFPDKPVAHPEPIQKKKKKIIELEDNPTTEFTKSKIDLDETSEIQVPHPDTIWVYKTENGSRKLKYLEIVVISKSAKKTKRSYLVPKNIIIKFDEVDPAGPIEKEAPLKAVKSLQIEGHVLRNEVTAA